MSDDPVKIEILLDDQEEPIAAYKPPGSFELDTTKLPDGGHRLHVRATDRNGLVGVREIPFVVRNGPGIAVVGLNAGDVVEGKISVLVNAYGGATERDWEPVRAETPAPIPTWAWVLFLAIVSWAMWYGAGQWTPGPEFQSTPTFSAPAAVAAAAPKPKAEPAALEVPGLDWRKLGPDVYHVRCGVCHQADGMGLPGFVPPVGGNPVVTAADPAEHIRTVLYGVRGKEIAGLRWAGEMPGFAGLLTDAEIAAVVDYERTSFGNSAPLASPAEVRALRRSQP